ncbi:glycosyltransferase [Acidiferrobacter sp.]|uniref:glycosyltransferase n=1 Tax=Acidiferrobacter sp. TaxID=1872107 RepID=UPI00262FD51D|nr:glycosyltransferase [Acidiferrobacter sp.]
MRNGAALSVRIIIPAYRAQARMAAAVHSMRAQSYGHGDLIVIADDEADDRPCCLLVEGPCSWTPGPAAAARRSPVITDSMPHPARP